MTVFAYARVSTTEQTVENQFLEIRQAGFEVDVDNQYSDVGVSGTVPALKRPQFAKLLDRIRKGETLVVCKIDRLGRNAADILQTVELLASRSIKVIVLQFGSVNLNSPAGKMFLTMFAAVAEMERELLVERVVSGQARARASGVKFGRKSKTTANQKAEIVSLLGTGESVSSVARKYGISRASVIAVRSTETQAA